MTASPMKILGLIIDLFFKQIVEGCWARKNVLHKPMEVHHHRTRTDNYRGYKLAAKNSNVRARAWLVASSE